MMLQLGYNKTNQQIPEISFRITAFYYSHVNHGKATFFKLAHHVIDKKCA